MPEKEIWKLLELLNEYDGDVLEYWFGDIRRKVKNFDNEKNTWKSVVWYTKQFWFIKWLVENDKIKIPHELDELPAMYWYDYDSVECKADRLLMLLSIQDEPIEFLCKILK